MRQTLSFLMLALVWTASPTLAQTSASYKLTEFTFNSGGDPLNGSFASSANFRIRMDSLGDPIGAQGPIGSASFHLGSGFAGSYAPPGEVKNLRFASQTLLNWDPEASVGKYSLYRDLVSTLPGSFGSCLQPALPAETFTDAGAPPANQAWLYLVTARNLIQEEGTKGFRSNGIERGNPSPCP